MNERSNFQAQEIEFMSIMVDLNSALTLFFLISFAVCINMYGLWCGFHVFLTNKYVDFSFVG